LNPPKELRESSEDKWMGLKDSVEEALADFRRSIENTMGRFSRR